jgi:hypothetical protein
MNIQCCSDMEQSAHVQYDPTSHVQLLMLSEIICAILLALPPPSSACLPHVMFPGIHPVLDA